MYYYSSNNLDLPINQFRGGETYGTRQKVQQIETLS